MSIHKEVLVTTRHKLMCNKCGEGEMQATGIALLSNPPKFPHKCAKCGEETVEQHKYPLVTYESSNQEEP